MPIIPIEPAKAVRIVRPFFVHRLLKLREREVRKDIFAFPILLCPAPSGVSSGRNGSLSSVTLPSRNFTILVEYCLASSELCVTITTNRFPATFFNSSMTCILVSLSSAPVGSSARSTSGSFTRARAIATRCICPPDIWFGFL